MAVDTANKRSSAIYLTSPWRSRLPFPDGVIAAEDRQHVAFLYSGILATGAVAVAADVTTWRPIIKPRRR